MSCMLLQVLVRFKFLEATVASKIVHSVSYLYWSYSNQFYLILVIMLNGISWLCGIFKEKLFISLFYPIQNPKNEKYVKVSYKNQNKPIIIL